MNTNQESRGGTLSRRHLLGGAAGAMAIAAGLPGVARAARRQRGTAPAGKIITKGRIKQSVCSWCFNPMPLETLAQNCVAMGITSVELVDPKDFPILKKYGLVSAMTTSHDLTVGFNDKANHDPCIEKIKKSVDACAAAGFPNVITFSGLRKGIPDDVGLKNAIEGLKKVIGNRELVKRLVDAGVRPHVVLEQGPEGTTPQTMGTAAVHQRSVRYVREVFGRLAQRRG